ncbi:MAG: hypothetical protein M3290_12810, partial [Actinomycetota bacterium]|nr:hypothetical protein [Actinomycetota bacterium]
MSLKTRTATIAIGAATAYVGALAAPAIAAPTGRIAFDVSSRSGDASSIYSVSADGTDLHRLTSRRGLAGRPIFTPDGSRIAFARGQTGQLWLMHDDGSNERRLTDGDKTKFAYQWSPDGHKLLFDAILNDNEDGQLRTATRRGKVRNLTHTPARFAGASWSPDGDHIVYSKDVSGGGNYEIFTMDRNGSRNHRLTHDPGPDLAPAWSISGIVYAHHSAKRPRAKLMLKRIGQRRSVLATFRQSEPVRPMFSPIGERIAFLR